MKCSKINCERPIDNDFKNCPWCGTVTGSGTIDVKLHFWGTKNPKQYWWGTRKPELFYLSLISILIIALFVPPRVTNWWRGGSYIVGRTGPGGGFVFYDRGDYMPGWRYLEVAPIDAEEGFSFWAQLPMQLGDDMERFKIQLGNPTFRAIGAGREPTLIWVNKLRELGGTATNQNNAASVCYTWGNREDSKRKDWYQPNIEELKVLYAAYRSGQISGLTNNKYLSITINDDGNILALDFSNGQITTIERTDSPSLRAIRRIERRDFPFASLRRNL